MDREDVVATKPKEPVAIRTVEELLKYQKDFNTGFSFTDKEAEIILDYMEGHDYVLGQIEGDLYRGDLCDKPDETMWEEFPMDDVIDSVCEWNYEFILDMDAERQNARDMIDFGNKQNRYDTLKQQEQILNKLFDQTKYAVVIEKTAEKLANEFLANLSKGKDMDAAVKDLTSVIIQPQAQGRAR